MTLSSARWKNTMVTCSRHKMCDHNHLMKRYPKRRWWNCHHAMEVSISAMCEHFHVPTCLVCCGFVISRDDVQHLQLSMAKRWLGEIWSKGALLIVLWLWFFKGLASGGILAWCHVCHIGFLKLEALFSLSGLADFTDKFIVSNLKKRRDYGTM